MDEPTTRKAPDEFALSALSKAELLLAYAAEVGIPVEEKVRDGVLKARTEREAGSFSEQTVSDLLAALTTLAAEVKPVTVESLKDFARLKKRGTETGLYGIMALVVGCIIVLISLLTFVSNRLSETIKADIDTANALATKLKAELGPSPGTNSTPPAAIKAPPDAPHAVVQDEVWFGSSGAPPGVSVKDIITDLQQFAATCREIDGYARELNLFLLGVEKDPYANGVPNRENMRRKLELKASLNIRLSQELTEKIETYQDVRAFANCVREGVSVWYGAVAACILPVLYALLGAGAYLLRLYEDPIANRGLISINRHSARFLIAGIGGLVVGLFNVTQGVSISPFALAFLAGYAVDVFFNFLEGLLQMFKRVPAGAAGQGTSKS